MCGIIGYVGYRPAESVIIGGLKALEYRGYDSAGYALIATRKEQSKHGNSHYIVLNKRSGEVDGLANNPTGEKSNIGIGHTRWATHGAPTALNAHPHLSYDKKVAIVHNGILENYRELLDYLEQFSVKPISSTDSELLAHLLALSLERSAEEDGKISLKRAIEAVIPMLKGAFTFLALSTDEPNTVYAYRKRASLIIGLGERENVIASDAIGLSGYATSTLTLCDGDLACIRASSVAVYNGGKRVYRNLSALLTKPIERCACYMRREIEQIPCALQSTYDSICGENGLDALSADMLNPKRIFISACGTAYHAGLYAKHAVETIANIPANVEIASEFESQLRFLSPNDLAIFISQSGETSDTIAALETAKARGALTLTLTNSAHSTLASQADAALFLDCGPEIGVAATKSYNCQLLALWLLACRLGGVKPPTNAIGALLASAHLLVSAPHDGSNLTGKKCFFIGKGADVVTAREGALKVKEITYQMTDAYPAGELKHGTIALMDENATAFAIVSCARHAPKMLGAISELRARKARIITVVRESMAEQFKSVSDETVLIPDLFDDEQSAQMLFPLLSVIPLQQIALSLSLALGLNPDKPRNLAKSVTVD